jgi:hypothetical protein
LEKYRGVFVKFWGLIHNENKAEGVYAKDKGLGLFYEINIIIFALEKVGK